MDNLITKKCSKCGSVKLLELFPTQKHGRLGHRADCCVCYNAGIRAKYAADPIYADRRRKAAREWSRDNPDKKHERRNRFYHNHPEREAIYARKHRLKAVYGITPEDYDVMLERQGGKCVCGRERGGKGHYHIDHDHSTGRVRGLLCYRCNHILGLAMDTPEILDILADYLRSNVTVTY